MVYLKEKKSTYLPKIDNIDKNSHENLIGTMTIEYEVGNYGQFNMYI